ncbi:MAG: aminotransferase class I/II-fold pyridoxal phosphate-dependent enzyme [Vicinamibacteria bacterium]
MDFTSARSRRASAARRGSSPARPPDIDYVNAFGARGSSPATSPVLTAGTPGRPPDRRRRAPAAGEAVEQLRVPAPSLRGGGRRHRSNSQVVPVMVNNDAKVFAVAEKIQDRGLYLNPVTSPAVPKHKSRLRISVSATREQDLEQAVQTIAGVLREEGICR